MKQLEIDIERLNDFFISGKVSSLSLRQRHYLKQQLRVMRKYCDILHKRLLYWEEKE